MRVEPSNPNRALALGLGSFAAWLGLLVLALSLENTAVGRGLFSSGGGGIAYLAVQGGLAVAALAINAWVLVRGPTRNRLIVLLPVIVLVLYAGILIGGPG